MHQLRVAVCRRRANIPVQVRGEAPGHGSVPGEQQWVPILAPVHHSVQGERQSVPISVLLERYSVAEEFVAHTAHAQSVPEERQTVAEQQLSAVSARF
jgi:dihydropteroate synthase